jgi:transposase
LVTGRDLNGALNIRERYIQDVWNSQELRVAYKKVVGAPTSTYRKDMQVKAMKQEAMPVRAG